MQNAGKLNPQQIRQFLHSSQEIRFKGKGRAEIYAWVARTLGRHGYSRQNRADKGLLRQYLVKMTGLSRAQITRLIQQYRQGGELQPARYRRHRFARKYTPADVELLAAVDEAHETLSGPATRKILEREYQQYQQREYERLAGISVAQIYRLRRRSAYRRRRLHFTKTRPTAVSIGERRRPDPQGRPGFLRVDTVHQGDRDGVKGVYHINAVDEVTQWQVVGATAAISEAWLEPLLKAMIEQFPFRIRGFHSDNGSEFLNRTVEKLLNKLLIEQTKSRPRHSNDNGLVESKNGAVIRKHMGYTHIAAPHAGRIQRFYQQHFNPYLNFHRPCGQPERSRPTPKASRSGCIATTRRLGNLSSSYPRPPATSSQGTRLRLWAALPRRKATLRRRAGCSEPNTSCLPVSGPRTRRAEQQEEGCGNGGRWKTRKTKTRFPFVSHRPWKSLRDSHIPTTPTTILPFPNQNQKTRKEPQLLKKPQPPSSGSSFDEKMLVVSSRLWCRAVVLNRPRSRVSSPHFQFDV